MSGFEEIDDCSWEGVYILNRCYDQFTDVKHPDDIELIKKLNKDQNEIDTCKSNPTVASSFFVIMQKLKIDKI